MKILSIATTGSCTLVFCLLFGGCQTNDRMRRDHPIGTHPIKG